MRFVATLAFAMILAAVISAAQSTANQEMANGPTPKGSQVLAGSATPKKTLAPNADKSNRTSKLSDKDQRAYAFGVELGLDVAKSGLNLNNDLLMRGVKDALTGGKLLMSFDDMNTILGIMQKEEHEKTVAVIKATAEKNKKEGNEFLAANKAKEGIVTLPSGLQYKVLKAADGKKAGLEDKVVCNYRGTLLDGTEIDSSYRRNESSTFPLKGVIKGWAEALQLMPVGSKWEVFIPSDLAYGERGDGRSIGPNATLIFEVELLSIQGKSETPDHAQGVATKPQGSL
jgi:FKBP-type peptidyl-prolyl cis-trans isomerase FklB